jgi:rare lipoprotein A (peptidoglycan hydrolase)
MSKKIHDSKKSKKLLQLGFFKKLRQGFVCLAFMLLSAQSITAQNIYPNTLTSENYLDSNNIKRYAARIDTNKIKIEVNRIKGVASFYSKHLNGTLTATGERFYNNKYTAASNLFKLNTIVRVTNLQNGHSVLVRINDRMHPNMLKKSRVIDLSQSAAKQLVFRSNGLVQVMVEAIGYAKTNPKKDDQIGL